MNTDKIREQIAALEKQLREAEEAERIAQGRTAAIQTISLIAAFKECLSKLKAVDGILGQVWHDIPAQALPREGNLAKAYDVSETETHNAKAKGRKAIEGL